MDGPNSLISMDGPNFDGPKFVEVLLRRTSVQPDEKAGYPPWLSCRHEPATWSPPRPGLAAVVAAKAPAGHPAHTQPFATTGSPADANS